MAGFHFSWSRFPNAGDHPLSRRPRRWLRLGAILAVLSFLAAWFVPKLSHRLAARSRWEAREDLRQQNYRQAVAALERAVQADGGNLEARHELALLYREDGSQRSLAAWRELVRLDPADDQNRYDWARSGLILGDLSAVREALSGIGPNGRSALPFMLLQAGLALRSGSRAVFAAEIAQLAALEHSADQARFDEASIELDCGDGKTARPVLEDLARGGPMSISATLKLIEAATPQGTPADYTELADLLLPRRSRPAILSWGAPPRGLFDLIAQMEASPKPSAADAALLGQWLLRQGYAPDAVFWLRTLAPAVQDAPAVLSVRATAFARTHDWSGLEDCLRQGAWGRISDEALILAFAARAQWQRRHEDHGEATWADAVAAAHSEPGALGALRRLADELGWPAAAAAAPGPAPMGHF